MLAIVGASLAGSNKISLEQCQWDQSPHYYNWRRREEEENPGKETQIPFLLSFGSFVSGNDAGEF